MVAESVTRSPVQKFVHVPPARVFATTTVGVEAAEVTVTESVPVPPGKPSSAVSAKVKESPAGAVTGGTTNDGRRVVGSASVTGGPAVCVHE